VANPAAAASDVRFPLLIDTLIKSLLPARAGGLLHADWIANRAPLRTHMYIKLHCLHAAGYMIIFDGFWFNYF
jgi:hypothetical protein